MPVYQVHGYELTSVTGQVTADTPEEAVEKAWNGEWDAGGSATGNGIGIDTEPAGNTRRRSWRADEMEGAGE
jgi:hypothetical protein